MEDNILKITNLLIEDRINDEFTSRIFLGENPDKLLDLIRDDVYCKLGKSLEALNAEITNDSVYIEYVYGSLFYHFEVVTPEIL